MRVEKFKCRACAGSGQTAPARECIQCGGDGILVREVWETAEFHEHMKRVERMKKMHAKAPAKVSMAATAREARLRLLDFRSR